MNKMAATPYMVKTLFFFSPEADDLGTWYVALGMWGLQSFLNDDP